MRVGEGSGGSEHFGPGQRRVQPPAGVLQLLLQLQRLPLRPGGGQGERFGGGSRPAGSLVLFIDEARSGLVPARRKQNRCHFHDSALVPIVVLPNISPWLLFRQRNQRFFLKVGDVRGGQGPRSYEPTWLVRPSRAMMVSSKERPFLQKKIRRLRHQPPPCGVCPERGSRPSDGMGPSSTSVDSSTVGGTTAVPSPSAAQTPAPSSGSAPRGRSRR